MAATGTKSMRSPGGKSEGKKGAYREKAKSAAADEPIPVIGGRFLIAAGFVLAMILIPFSPIGRAEPKGPEPTDMASWTPGGTGRVRITLITADYQKLTCAAEQQFEGNHCAYKSESELWPRDPGAPLDDNKKNVIQPYRTWPDNKLVLVAGLWADPVVAMRLHREPPQVVVEKKLARFVVDCEMKFLGKLEDSKLRWGPGQQWQKEGAAWVIKPTSCKLKED
jgi:hypothetical protein